MPFRSQHHREPLQPHPDRPGRHHQRQPAQLLAPGGPQERVVQFPPLEFRRRGERIPAQAQHRRTTVGHGRGTGSHLDVPGQHVPEQPGALVLHLDAGTRPDQPDGPDPPRHQAIRVRTGEIGGKLGSGRGEVHPDVPRAVVFPRLLRCSRFRHVVPFAAQRPRPVSLRPEARGGVGRLADVGHHRHAVDRDPERTDVEVVVPLTVVPRLDGHRQPVRRPGSLSRDQELHARQPFLAGEPGSGRFLRERPAPSWVRQSGEGAAEPGLRPHEPAARSPAARRVGADVGVAEQLTPPVEHVPRLRDRQAGRRVTGVDVGVAAQVHAVREADQRGQHRKIPGVEPARLGEEIECFQQPAGAVPPVRDPFVDPAVVGQHGDVVVEPFDDQPHEPQAPLLVGFEQERGGEDGAVDPRVPVVRVAVQAQPVPVADALERRQDPEVHLAL